MTKTVKFLKIYADSLIDADFHAESNGGTRSWQMLPETDLTPVEVGFIAG